MLYLNLESPIVKLFSEQTHMSRVVGWAMPTRIAAQSKWWAQPTLHNCGNDRNVGLMQVNMAKARVHIIIKGIVQGVFFRANTKKMAERNAVNGWIKNMPDGTVEALFEGEEETVKNVIEWCHHGPSGAVVEKVKTAWEKYQNEFKDFIVIQK